MSHILIVGRKFESFTSYLRDNGHTYTLLLDSHTTKKKTDLTHNRIVVDFKDNSLIEEALSALPHAPDAVMTTYENYVLPAAKIAKHLGLPGLNVEAAEACTDKFIMRGLFEKAPFKISPAFAVVNNIDELKEFAQNHDFPLILKPTNLAKSLLVTKNHNLDELVMNYTKSMELLHGVYSKYAPTRNPKLIIEEFLEGSIHSVEAFVDGSGNPKVLDQVVDYQTGYDIGFDDNFHYSRILPSKLSEDQQNQLRECADVGIRALGMTNSPAHVEIIMTQQGPRIVEIGARNGGYRERMHRLANGIDISGIALDIALGKKPNISVTKNDDCAVLELFPKTPGNFRGIAHLKELYDLSSTVYVSIKAKPAQFVGKSADGHKMCAVIILNNADSKQFNDDLQFVNDHVYVEVDS
jgi:biotin carboxylase